MSTRSCSKGPQSGVPLTDEESEQDVETTCVQVFRETEGLVLAMYSPQNVDRLVSVYRAAKRSGRVLVMDLYAAELVRALGRDTIPQPEWDGVRVYVPHSQRAGVIRIRRIRANRLHPLQPDLQGRTAGGKRPLRAHLPGVDGYPNSKMFSRAMALRRSG